MMHSLITVSCALILLALGAGMTTTQPTQGRARTTAVTANDLRPEQPRTYLWVGETLARDPNSRLLARETLATGAMLAAKHSAETGDTQSSELAASMIIALASLGDDADTHRGLWMLALSLDAGRAESFRWLGADALPDDAHAQEAARVLGLLRRNDPDAIRDITEAHRRRIIDEAKLLGLDATRIASVLRKWETDTRNDPCKGRLFVRKREGDATVVSPCPLPGFHHGSVFNDDWAMMAAIELSLAGHTPDSWSVRGAIGLDRPVPIWTLDRLGETFGVSADRPVYRSGRWVAR